MFSVRYYPYNKHHHTDQVDGLQDLNRMTGSSASDCAIPLSSLETTVERRLQKSTIDNLRQEIQILKVFNELTVQLTIKLRILSETHKSRTVQIERDLAEATKLMQKFVQRTGFYCPICYEMTCDVVMKCCGHEFCKECILKHFEMERNEVENSKETLSCPLCRTSVGALEEELYNVVIRLFRDEIDFNVNIL